MGLDDHFQPSLDISRQLEELIANLDIDDLRAVHDLTNTEVDFLLNTIQVKTGEPETLMDLFHQIAYKKKLTNEREYYNLKIKVIIDNLAKKMCRCIPHIDYPEEGRQVAVCRKTIFQNRGIDFGTFQCDKGALLKPVKGSKKILRRYVPK